MKDQPMSLIEHLGALRRALIISIISIIPGTIVGWYIKDKILNILIYPVSRLNYKLVYIGATEALTAQLTVAVAAGVVVATPVIAYQVWKFILPALHTHEKRYIAIFAPVSVLLFVIGVLFGYYTVYTAAIGFLLSFGGEGLTPMLSLSRYLSFAVWFLLPFGVMFELPLIMMLLARMGIVTPAFLAARRRWALLLAFVAAAVATPTTDMFTQSVMGLAIYVLYEISIWLSYLVRSRKRPANVVSGEESSSGESAAGIPEDAAKEPPDPPEPGPELAEIYRDIVDRGGKKE